MKKCSGNSIRVLCIFLASILLCLCSGNVSFAATNNAKYYRLTKCKITYNSTIGQVRVNWNETEKETDIKAYLYQDGILLKYEVVSGMSWDITELIDDTGILTVESYPVRLDSSYSITSNDMNITETMLEKIRQYDPWPYQPSFGELNFNKETGKITGTWDFNEKKSNGVVKLYRGDTAVNSWRSYSESSCDFTDIVAEKGTGTYKFKIYPSRLGDCHAIFSYELDVDSDMLKALKAAVSSEKKAEEAARIGWYREEGSTYIWKYYKTPGVLAKKEWLNYKGKTYYFTSSGIMQIGWQVINDKYYYFDYQGALVTGTTTPDGFTVNEKGEWIDGNGITVSANGEREAPSTPVTLHNCSISVSESTKAGPGIIREADFRNSTGYRIDRIVYSIPFENWTAGVGVTVKIEVSALTNYSFGSGITFSVRGCKNVSSSGDSKKRTILFSYIPKMQLYAPEFVYYSSMGKLCWKKVQKASRYKLVITGEEDSKTTVTVNTNSCDLNELIDINSDYLMTVKIYAMGSNTTSTYYLTSAAFSIDDLKDFSQKYLVEGDLIWNDSGLRYLDENGDRITGWKQLFGNWYYFKKSGYAAGPGWYQDTDKLWYYFDNEHRMCTGSINDGVADYFLNDGTVTNLPLGAWVKDRR